MPDFDYREKRFEEDIEQSFLSNGYIKGDAKVFDRNLALDVNAFLSFILDSQPREWARYVKVYGEESRRRLVERFCREVVVSGILTVIRTGFTDRGIKFYPLFFKPETDFNETATRQYHSNVFTCTRQLRYSTQNENSVDIVLFINGIPLVSMELKCEFTGQDTENAIRQYKFDRASKETIFDFDRRVLVHFAVDLTRVFMTTKLEGGST